MKCLEKFSWLWQSEHDDAENSGQEAIIIKKWEGDFPILSAAWAPTADNSYLFSLASFYEQSENFISVVKQKGEGEFSEICEPVDHEYPVTDSTWTVGFPALNLSVEGRGGSPSMVCTKFQRKKTLRIRMN